MGRTYERLFFDSGYEPHAGEPGRERWLSYTGNNREYGLMFRHRQPRPWLVCVHGAEMGRAALDPTLFRAWHLYSDLGLNVVLPVLPMHGPRARGLPKGAAFPSEDVLNDVHGAAQAVWDIRRLLSWIRSQQPEAMIGLNGISLGGYLTSLVASLDDGLTCAILGVPAVDLVEVVDRHAGLSGHDALGQTMRLAKPIGRMISPFAATPRVPMQGRFIYAGIADRLVHPRDQVPGSGSTGADPRSTGTPAATPGSSAPGRYSDSSTTRWCSRGLSTRHGYVTNADATGAWTRRYEVRADVDRHPGVSHFGDTSRPEVGRDAGVATIIDAAVLWRRRGFGKDTNGGSDGHHYRCQ